MSSTLAFEKFKSMDSKASPVLKAKGNKISTTKKLISDLSNKLTSSTSEKKKETSDAAEARKAERDAKRAEEEKKYSGMKPVQAMFNKSIAARSSDNKTSNKPNPIVPSVSVSDIKDKVRRKSLISSNSSRNSVDLDFIPDLPVQSALDVYTKGNCRTLKDKFETDIQLKKNSNMEVITRPIPVQRRKTGPLPDMFEQQKKRDESLSLNKIKDTGVINKENINDYLDRFESSDSRKKAKDKMIELTNKQKSLSVSKWSERESNDQQEDKDMQFEMDQFQTKHNQEKEEAKRKFLESSSEEKEDTKKVKSLPTKTKQMKDKSIKDSTTTLPTINSSTFSDMRRKLQEKTMDNSKKEKTYTPIRKLRPSKFEEYSTQSTSSVTSPEIISTVPKLSEIKKRLVIDKNDAQTPFVAFKSKKVKIESESRQKTPENESHLNDKETTNAIASTEEMQSQNIPLTENKEILDEKSEKRSSKSQMQNYLLSKVLFDDKNDVQKEEEPMEVDDTPIDITNDPYFQEIEKYLALIGGSEEGKKTSKKKKISDSKKPKKKNLKLKVVELDELKNKFETKKEAKSDGTSPAVSSPMLLDKKVDKFREKFESSHQRDTNAKERKPLNTVRRRSGVISSDLLCKFDSPEELEKLKKQREEEREARRISRLQKLEEEQRRLEQEARLEKERLEAERLENEKLKEQERERLAEEARIAAACEEMMRKEKEKAEARRQKEEEMKSRREKNEPALKKKKVLGRIQHIFEKDKVTDPNPTPQKAIGSIKDKAEELFQQKLESTSNGKTPFQDSSLTGMSVNRFKDKFETELSKQDEPVHLYSKSEKKKRVPLQTAIDFDNLNNDVQQESASSISSQNGAEWSWKKKDQGQLAVETTMAMMKNSPKSQTTEKKSQSSNKLSRSNENTEILLKELHSASERLCKKDALQEHEMKMKEYEEFIDEIQSFLNEPIQDISDCLDEVRREKKTKKAKTKKGSGDKMIKTKKEKKFRELLQFMKANQHFIPRSIQCQIQDDMEYKAFLKVIDVFLSAPDRSVEEIEFKDQIESMLDDIEEGINNLNPNKKKGEGPDITESCVMNKGSSLLPDVVEGGLRSRRRSLIDESASSIKKSSSMADFQNEMSKYRSLLDSKGNKISDSKWKIGRVDTSFLEKTDEDDKNLDGKRVGPPSAYAKEIHDKLTASVDSSKTDLGKLEKKKKIILDSFVPKSDENLRGIRDLKQFIYKNRTELPIEVLDFDCSDKDLISKVRTFAFSDGEKPLKEEIKIYLELASGPSNSFAADSIKTDHVADMRKKIFESTSKSEQAELYSAPRRKLVNLETSTSASEIQEPLRRSNSIDIKKFDWPSKNISVRSVNPTPSPPVHRGLSKSASDAAVFKMKPSISPALDSKEREAAILAKYGVKPRPIARDSDSSSSSDSDSEEEEDIKKIISQDPRLQSIYGDRLLSTEDIPRKSKASKVDSLSALRNILGTMRQPQVEKTSSSHNMKSVFENAKSTEAIPQRVVASKVQKSTSFANIKNFAALQKEEDEEEEETTRPTWQCAPSGLSRSSSFHRFKSAIEKSEEESSQQSNNSQVQAELDAIRSCSRLQRLFAINKPSSGVSRSHSSSAIDTEVVSDISQARESIRSAFESNHAKMSYGVKLRNEKPKPVAKPQAQTTTAGKKWVYDTINKYFDVIVEDDESDEDEEDEDEEEDSSTELDLDSSVMNEESDLEIKDFSTIISSRNNYALKRTKSSVKLRSMISSVMVEKSISVDSMNVFKANLCSHLQKSQTNVTKT